METVWTWTESPGFLGVRIDAQEARAPVESVRKVAFPLFFSVDYTGLFGSPGTEIIGSVSCNL